MASPRPGVPAASGGVARPCVLRPPRARTRILPLFVVLALAAHAAAASVADVNLAAILNIGVNAAGSPLTASCSKALTHFSEWTRTQPAIELSNNSTVRWNVTVFDDEGVPAKWRANVAAAMALRPLAVIGGEPANAPAEMDACEANGCVYWIKAALQSLHERDRPNSYGVMVPSTRYADQFLRTALLEGFRTVSFVMQGTPLPRATCAAARAYALSIGLVPHVYGEYPAISTPDMARQINAIAGNNSDLVFACGFVADTLAVSRLLFNRTDYRPRLSLIMGAPTEASWASLGPAGEYVMGPTQWTATSPGGTAGSKGAGLYFPSAAAYTASFRERWGEEPNYMGATCAAMALVTYHAVRTGRSAAPGDVRAILNKMNVQTFFGPIRFGVLRENIAKDAVVVQILGGAQRAVLPVDVAEPSRPLPLRGGARQVKPVVPDPLWEAMFRARGCGPGEFLDTSARVLACRKCEPGSFSPARGSAEACLPCPAGTFAPARGASSCLPCGPSQHTLLAGARSEADCLCSRGSYSPPGAPPGANSTCLACPAGGLCEGDGRLPLAAVGWWSGPEAPLTFYKCTYAMCPGAAPGACAEHHRGPLCGECVEGYYLSAGACKPCTAMAYAGPPVVVVCVLVCTGALFWFLLRTHFVGPVDASALVSSRTLPSEPGTPGARDPLIGLVSLPLSSEGPGAGNNNSGSEGPAPASRRLSLASRTASTAAGAGPAAGAKGQPPLSASRRLFAAPGTREELGTLVVTVFTTMQILSLTKVSPAPRPGAAALGEEARVAFAGFALTNLSLGFLQLECLGMTLVTKGWLVFFLPFFVGVLLLPLARTARRPASLALSGVVVTVKALYVPLSSNAIRLFLCYPQPDGRTTWQDAPSVFCRSATWNGLLPASLLSLLFYTAGLPLFFIVMPALAKEGYIRALPTALVAAWRVQTRVFRPGKELWNALLSLRSLALFLSLALLQSYAVVRALVFAIITMGSAVGLATDRPYLSARANRLEIVGAIVQAATFIIVVAVAGETSKRGVEQAALAGLAIALLTGYVAFALAYIVVAARPAAALRALSRRFRSKKKTPRALEGPRESELRTGRGGGGGRSPPESPPAYSPAAEPAAFPAPPREGPGTSLSLPSAAGAARHAQGKPEPASHGPHRRPSRSLERLGAGPAPLSGGLAVLATHAERDSPDLEVAVPPAASSPLPLAERSPNASAHGSGPLPLLSGSALGGPASSASSFAGDAASWTLVAPSSGPLPAYPGGGSVSLRSLGKLTSGSGPAAPAPGVRRQSDGAPLHAHPPGVPQGVHGPPRLEPLAPRSAPAPAALPLHSPSPAPPPAAPEASAGIARSLSVDLSLGPPGGPRHHHPVLELSLAMPSTPTHEGDSPRPRSPPPS
eukprot:tig00021073_g18022.t1